MDIDPKKMTFIGSIRIQPSTFDRARDLLKLAGREDKLNSTIAACSVVLCSAGLAKMIADLLLYRAEMAAFDDQVRIETTKFGILLNRGLVTQIKECPYMISEGRFYIQSSNPVFLLLRRMVELRNGLAHIPDGTLLLHGDDPWIKIENDVATIEVPILPDPWGMVTIEEAQQMYSASMCYWNDIEPNGDMKEGKLLTKSSGQGDQGL